MAKSFFNNRFYSWYTVIFIINLMIAGLGAKDVRFMTIAIILLIISLVQDIKAYVAKQLNEDEASKHKKAP